MDIPLGERVELVAPLTRIRLLAMDVDGVLTDGTLDYDRQGGARKRFHTADGLGLVVLAQMGVSIAWITGRADTVVERRATELGVGHLIQNVRDKGKALERLSASLHVTRAEVAYIGDDWNDLPAFAVAGVRLAVANAAIEVKQRADAVTLAFGGAGAVREVCAAILKARGLQVQSLEIYLASLCEPED